MDRQSEAERMEEAMLISADAIAHTRLRYSNAEVETLARALGALQAQVESLERANNALHRECARLADLVGK